VGNVIIPINLNEHVHVTKARGLDQNEFVQATMTSFSNPKAVTPPNGSERTGLVLFNPRRIGGGFVRVYLVREEFPDDQGMTVDALNQQTTDGRTLAASAKIAYTSQLFTGRADPARTARPADSTTTGEPAPATHRHPATAGPAHRHPNRTQRPTFLDGTRRHFSMALDIETADHELSASSLAPSTTLPISYGLPPEPPSRRALQRLDPWCERPDPAGPPGHHRDPGQ
jgi:hypothetical protein